MSWEGFRRNRSLPDQETFPASNDQGKLRETVVWIAGGPAQIRTEHLSNASL
jgi:hypothetical protein